MGIDPYKEREHLALLLLQDLNSSSSPVNLLRINRNPLIHSVDEHEQGLRVIQ
jgi:hypothetical protein